MPRIRTEIANLQEEVDRLRSASATKGADYRDDPTGLMALGGTAPDPWQTSVLEATGDALLCITRQGGKSTTVAAKAVHTALYEPYSVILICSPTLRQSQELFHKVTYLYRASGEIVATETHSALQMELANRSRIVVLPGSERTVRGYSGVDLVIIDEAARVSDDLFYALRPMLAVSEGQMIALSTPWGQRGWFYHEWITAGSGWERVRVTANECPRISDTFLEKERRRMPVAWFESEYMCEFTETVDSVFRKQDIDDAFTDEVEPLFEWFEEAA